MEIEYYDAAMMIAKAASKLEVWTTKMEDFRVWFFRIWTTFDRLRSGRRRRGRSGSRRGKE
jgi:hypothetical protein